MYIVGIVLFVVGLGFISRMQGFAIKGVLLEGATLVEKKDVDAIVNADLSGSYLHLFAKRNILLYPKEKIEQDLLAGITRIESVKVTTTKNNILSVRVNERGGQYLWCGDSPAIPKPCLYIDANAYIFAEAPYFSDNVYFKFYGTPTSINPNTGSAMGSHLLPTEEFDKLLIFKNSLKLFGFRPQALYLDPSGDYELLLERGATGSDLPKVIFSKDADFAKVGSTLQTGIESEPLLSLLKKNYAKLLYLDLRFKNKIFYKFAD